jgi:hypothetical protein
MKRRPRKRPFQYGLASLFLLTTFVAVAVWLGPAYWLHIATMFGRVLVCVALLSLVGGVLILPYVAAEGIASISVFVRDLVLDMEDRQSRGPRRKRPPEGGASNDI